MLLVFVIFLIKPHKPIFLINNRTEFQMFQRFGIVTLVCLRIILFHLLQIIKEVHIFRHSQKLEISVVHLDAPISQHKCPVVFIILGD